MSKKIFFSIALMFCICKMNAQITLEHTYNTGTVNFEIYKLSLGGIKYVVDSSTTSAFNIKIYNSNYTLYKSIHFTNVYGTIYPYLFCYAFSDNLFDNDSDIEFAVNLNSSTDHRFIIFNEDGTMLMNKNNFSGDARIAANSWIAGFVTMPDGTKMILHTATNPIQYKIYSLPGSLPCFECSEGSFTGNRATNSGDYPEAINSQIFPNPSSSQTEIAYELPDGCRQATLKVFSIEGTLLKTFTITSDFDSIVLSNEDLAAGTYFYKIETPKGESDAKKFVIVQQ